MKAISSDLLRGNIDAFVLSVLSEGKMYGNEIKNRIKEKTQNVYIPNEQSLYSAYHRLEKYGAIIGSWGEDFFTATRKYYELTDLGRQLLQKKAEEWQRAKLLIDLLIR